MIFIGGEGFEKGARFGLAFLVFAALLPVVIIAIALLI